MEQESVGLPYRWGYFQGAALFPWSLYLVLGSSWALRQARYEPWYISVIVLVIGLVGFPLGAGLLMKRKFALPLVYVMFGLCLVLVAAKLPVAIRHFASSDENGSAFPEAELLMVWAFSAFYYKRRKAQFR